MLISKNAKIDKIGFEIEGEFYQSTRLHTDLQKYGNIGTDGSLSRCYSSAFHREVNQSFINYELREFRSNPFPVSKLGDIKEFFDILGKKSMFHWNESMGFHIHFSFIPLKPPEIWSSLFCEYMADKISKEFPDEWELRKRNNYCKNVYSDNGILKSNNDKYQFINFNMAYSEHKTIELRIFPAEKPEKMYEYLCFSVKAIEEFIENGLGNIKKSVEASFFLKKSVINERINLQVPKIELTKQIDLKTKNKVEINGKPKKEGRYLPYLGNGKKQNAKRKIRIQDNYGQIYELPF